MEKDFFFFAFILQVAFKIFKIPGGEIITGWKDFPSMTKGRKKDLEKPLNSGCMQYESFHEGKLLGNLSCVRS